MSDRSDSQGSVEAAAAAEQQQREAASQARFHSLAEKRAAGKLREQCARRTRSEPSKGLSRE